MTKDKPARRPRAETPRGFRDYFGAEVTERLEMLAKIAEVYRMHGFDPLETSAVETVEALGKFLPDVDRPNEGVFGWQDEDQQWLALRYDLTAPLARVAAQYRNDLPMPYRRYAMGPVWRNEKPGPGRFRQFYQCDADTVGSASVAADAEICAMLAGALEALGLKDDTLIRVNNRKVLNGVMEAAGIAGPNFERERGIVLRAIDKLDRLGTEGVEALLGPGRMDASGDFTKGANLSTLQIQYLMRFVEANDYISSELSHYAALAQRHQAEHRHVLKSAQIAGDRELSDLFGRTPEGNAIRNFASIRYLRELVERSQVGRDGVDELEQISDLLDRQGFGPDRIVIDPSVVRGLGYYTGPVFEAELTFTILDEKGRPRQFGSVAGGGRYDDLIKRFTGQEVPATGVSIGVDRLLAALRAKRGAEAEPAAGPVVVTVMDRDRMADYMAMAAELRNAGVRTEVYLGNPKNFGNQLRYADKRNSFAAVIQGADEAASNKVIVKDLRLGKFISDFIDTPEKWGQQAAQRTVDRSDLIQELRRIEAIKAYRKSDDGSVSDQDGNILVLSIFF